MSVPIKTIKIVKDVQTVNFYRELCMATCNSDVHIKDIQLQQNESDIIENRFTCIISYSLTPPKMCFVQVSPSYYHTSLIYEDVKQYILYLQISK